MARPRRDRPVYHLRRIPGRRYWHIVWSEPGSRASQKVSTGETDEAAAQHHLREWLDQRERPGAGGWTVAQALAEYVADRRDHGVASLRRIQSAADALAGGLGDMPVESLTAADLKRYRAKRKITTWTYATEIAKLRAACRLALKRGRIQALPDIPPPPKGEPRARYLTREQADALLAATQSDHLRTFIIIGLNTGARRQAILDLTWDRVDFDTGLVDFAVPGRARTRKRRVTAPMNGEMRAALCRAREIAQSDHVIEWRGKPVGDIIMSFRRAAKTAGVPWCTPHVLRHTAATWLAMAGVELDRIADLLGASPQTVWTVYRKFQPTYLVEVSAALERYGR